MRGYRFISIKEKILIVSQVIAGEKVKLVADKHRVSRPSVYSWTQRALGALEEALKPDKKGPKLKRTKLKIKKQNEEIDRLKNIIKKKEEQIKELRGKMDFQKKDIFRPLKCPHCGFEKIYRNGTYKIGIEKLLDELKKRKVEEITVQQFICSYCKRTVRPKKNGKIILLYESYRGNGEDELRR